MSNLDRKRKQPDDQDPLQDLPLPSRVKSDLNEFAHNLQREGGRDLLARGLAALANYCSVTYEDLEMIMDKPQAPSSWKDIAPKLSLDPMGSPYQLKLFSLPKVSLPPSFYDHIFWLSSRWLDVYQQRGAHNEEAVRARLLEAWHVPVCALFNGWLVDQPVPSMHATPESSGRGLEHEVYMMEGIILLIFEMNLTFKSENDSKVQVLEELVAAYEKNSKKGFNPQPPVYALLMDLKYFYFFRYDGSHFTRAEEIVVSQNSHSTFLAGMRQVSDQLFSILLEGFIATLSAVVAQLTTRQETFRDALINACEARDILTKSRHDSLEHWEEAGSLGLEHISKSTSLLSQVETAPDWSDWDTTKLNNEIDSILSEALITTSSSSKDHDL